MTRTEALALVNYMINRNAGDLRWGQDDTEILEYIRRANEEVWYDALDMAPERMITTVSFTYPANTLSVTLTGAGFINAEYHKILSVVRTSAAGAPSATNPVSGELYEMPWQHRQDVQEGGVGPELGRYYYAHLGDSLQVRPTTANSLFLTVEYHPLAPNINSGGAPANNELLTHPTTMTAGRMVRHHELVCVLAAQRALIKVREQSPYLDATEDRLRKRFVQDLVTSRSHQHPTLGQSPYSAAAGG